MATKPRLLHRVSTRNRPVALQLDLRLTFGRRRHVTVAKPEVGGDDVTDVDMADVVAAGVVVGVQVRVASAMLIGRGQFPTWQHIRRFSASFIQHR